MSESGSFWPAAFSSETDEWATPRNFFRQLDHEFNFSLDPCSTHENAKCARHFTRDEDGLAQSWVGEVVFMNPPYGDAIGDWMRKAWQEARAGATVVCLVPARTDTAWWHDYAAKGSVRFIRGRLKFGAAKNSAPFPSAIVIFRPPVTRTIQSTGEQYTMRTNEDGSFDYETLPAKEPA